MLSLLSCHNLNEQVILPSPLFSPCPAGQQNEQAAGWMLGYWPQSAHQPRILIYQLLRNTIPKCATINPVLHLRGKFNHHLSLQIILKSKTVLERNSSLLATSEQNSCKSQDSVPTSSHHNLATARARHQVNTLALFQLCLLNFQRQQLFSIVHQASSTGCMKIQSRARQSTSQVSNELSGSCSRRRVVNTHLLQ